MKQRQEIDESCSKSEQLFRRGAILGRMIRVLVVFVVACGGGQSPAGVGGTCDLGATPNEIVISQPVSACPTKICLHVLGSTPDQCTDHCETADDCIADPTSSCTAGFTCAPVLSVGPFACQNLCVCSDRVPATSCP